MALNSLKSFAGKTRAMIVDLTRGYAAEAPRVMPLGDSNTYGESPTLSDDKQAAYRASLWLRVTNGGDWIDYVGDHSNGPAKLQDLNHQGVGGIRATTVAADAENIGKRHHPDVVLMMLGTNDALNEADAASTVPADLLAIMHAIERGAPGTAFLVAPLPPIDPQAPGYYGGNRADADAIRDAVNAQLPGMVAEARAAGLDARFVPMPTLGAADLFDGVHPNLAGYQKIAAAWHDALEAGLDSGAYGGARTSMRGVRDVTGSERGDFLRGDGAANKIFGRAGADRIEAMSGSDDLTGGGGADVFVFSSPRQGSDRIRDFRSNDFIEIDVSAFKGGLRAGGTAVLHSDEHPRAHGSGGQFLYVSDDGRLYWDADGAGGVKATLLATLSGAPEISESDFLLVV